MAVVKCKPTSAGRRFVVKVTSPELHKGEPFGALLEPKSRSGGRNNKGRITQHRYVIAAKGLKADDQLLSGELAPIKVGNCLPLRNIPVGSVVHCIELKPGKGAQLARSAGAAVQLVARDGRYATLRLRSGEMRKVLADCKATIGEVSNSEHNLRSLGKAGAVRWRGVRPTVRGVAMNPVDHPHGGGEGRTSGGRHPVSPWGQPTKGHKTRKNKRTTKYIVRARNK